MTLTQIRNRIHSLQRRFGLPLTIIRLRPYATQFCDQWAIGPRPEGAPTRDPALHQEAGRRRLPSHHLHVPPPPPQEAPRKQHLSPAQQHRCRPRARCLSPQDHRRRLPMGPPSRPFPVTRPRNPSQFTHALLQPTLPFRAAANGQRATGNGANTLTSASPRHLPIDASPLHRYHYPQNTQQAREWE